jgi:hypothetical protein
MVGRQRWDERSDNRGTAPKQEHQRAPDVGTVPPTKEVVKDNETKVERMVEEEVQGEGSEHTAAAHSATTRKGTALGGPAARGGRVVQ